MKNRTIVVVFVLLLMLLLMSSCMLASDYERIVIETYPWKSGVAPTDTTLRLFDSSGTEIAFNEDIGPGDVASRIDYTAGLQSGTYYIKITSDKGNAGPYVIRALDLTLGQDLPPYEYPGVYAVEPWPDGDDASTDNIPDAPKPVSLGSSNYLNRNLNKNTVFPPALPGDVDWCLLTLPPRARLSPK